MTTMHRALQLNDIIYMLFRHVNEPSVNHEPGGNVGQKTLAVLARTCRIFHEPALDVLWGDLYFPQPLIRCLPDSGDQWHLKDHTKPLTARDWEVLQKYVPRVLSLTFHSETPFYRNVLKALRQSPVAQPPLPNLQRLDYRHLIPEDYRLLDIFFVPSLTDLAIQVHRASFPDISFISPLATSCPRLTSFRLFGYGSHELIKATVSDVIMGLPHLQTLHCDELSSAAITFVAWHPSLTELDIFVPSGHQYDLSQCPHPTLPRIPPFSRIKTFGMHSVHLSSITAFIQAVQPSPSHLRIATSQCSSPQDFQELFSTLSNKRRHESVQIIGVQSYPPHEYPSVASVDMDTIKPLLSFLKLRELHLLIVNSYDFSDEDLTAMGASWPCLEVIDLNNGDARATITLRSLILLVNKCAHLRTARLPINANILEGIEECPTSMVGANDLQQLLLPGTVVKNPRAVALIVSLAFPKVKKIGVGGLRRGISHEPSWDKVNEYLEAFRLFQGGRWRT
ncbi:uncharacterized protein EDB91DRAFT_1245889 [Suillus paluster]|uniref:uncharacterized protein n=1 Tax=Suillus paluster TaxID=48578 RepID=UPI001B88042A|nr:uncharacterized protein EDB91DRAFT_1245889 [Suillus paluster]KAG1746706.1 hypothetical protein EDB91DRAFT_1245889 [Suillus paluster]